MTKKTLNETQEKLFAPIAAFNDLALANTQRLVDLQIEGLKKYTGVALSNWSDALQVKDATGAQAYVAKQAEVAKQVVDSLSTDAEALQDLSREFATQAAKLTESVAVK